MSVKLSSRHRWEICYWRPRQFRLAFKTGNNLDWSSAACATRWDRNWFPPSLSLSPSQCRAYVITEVVPSSKNLTSQLLLHGRLWMNEPRVSQSLERRSKVPISEAFRSATLDSTRVSVKCKFTVHSDWFCTFASTTSSFLQCDCNCNCHVQLLCSCCQLYLRT